MKRELARPKFEVGQVVRIPDAAVYGRIISVKWLSKRGLVRGWYYKMRYPGDCEICTGALGKASSGFGPWASSTSSTFVASGPAAAFRWYWESVKKEE